MDGVANAVSMEGFRLSPQQRRLWRSGGQHPAYRARGAVLVEGTLDVEALRRALDDVVERNEILRTTFQLPPGLSVPLQVIRDHLAPAWETAEPLTEAGPHGVSHESVLELLDAESAAPFDPENGPLVRIKLVPLAREGAVDGARHLLLVVLPALLADAKTLANLVTELAGAYAQRVESGQPFEEALQYADLAEWQNDLQDAVGGQADSGRAFWREHATSSSRSAALPFLKRASASGSFEPGTFLLELNDDVVPRIAAAAQHDGSSADVVLLGAWQTLVARLAGITEGHVGIVCDGRTLPDLEGALGLFARAVPVPGYVTPGMRFSEVVAELSRGLAAAAQWQEFFTPEAVEEGSSNQPPLQILFEASPPSREAHAGGVTFSIVHADALTEPFVLKLSVQSGDGTLRAAIQYDRGTYNHAEIERIAGHLHVLLGSALGEPETRIGELEILSEADRKLLLVDLNQTSAEYPRGTTMHELFEQQVALTPDAVAVVADEERLTYRDLNQRANRLAHRLRGHGVTPQDVVGLCVGRSTGMIVGLLGILKAGAAYLPLIPEHPPARLAHQLAETRAQVVVTETPLLDRLPEPAGELVLLDRDPAGDGNEADDNPSLANPSLAVDGDALAYVIYTSGSTGLPKGVAIRHSNLVNYTHFICERVAAWQRHLHFATVSPLGADLGNTCIFPSLVSGGSLHVVSAEVAADSSLLADYVQQHGVDVLKIVPSHMNALLAGGDDTPPVPRRYLILGGEALSWELAGRIAEVTARQGLECRVINHYGPTETTVGSLTFGFEAHDGALLADGPAGAAQHADRPAATVPIGRPIANTELYILDQHRRPVPIGVPGELWIGGAGVAPGYVNQNEETEERFLAHPFSGNAKARLYRSGDVARYLPDGNVEFLGRIDDQVKIRGYRIELGEVEAAVTAHPAVRQAAVTAAGEDPASRRLVAYVVAGNPVPTDDDLRTFVQQTLPDYMVPSAFVVLDELPLTRSGKLDRAGLPAQEELTARSNVPFAAPRGALEALVARTWSDVLGLEQVGIHDNFFDLGGHSLMVTQVVARLRDACRVALPLQSVFESPTVAELATAIARAQAEDGTAALLSEVEGLTDEEARRLLEQQDSSEHPSQM